MPYKERRDRAAAQARYREKILAVLTNAKQAGCADCGETDPIVLQFHHRDPALKKFNVARGAGKSMPMLLRELEKCDVVCANCHLRRHAANVD